MKNTPKNGRIISRGLTIFAAVGSFLLVLLSSGFAEAGLVTIAPPLPPATALVTASPVTWNVGCGYIVFAVPTAAHPGNGAVVIDPHAKSCEPASGRGGGTHGSKGVMAGFNVPYVCVGPCVGDTKLTATYSGTWYNEADLSCVPGGAVTSWFQVNVTLLNAAGGIIATNLISVSYQSYTTPITSTLTGSMATLVYAVTFPPLAAGTTYGLETFLWGEAYTHCPENGPPNSYAFSEVDVGARYPVALTTLTLT